MSTGESGKTARRLWDGQQTGGLRTDRETRPIDSEQAAVRRPNDYTGGSPQRGMVAEIDPRELRFGQAITAVLAAGTIVLREPVAVAALAVLLALPVVSRWQIDAYRSLWPSVSSLLGPSLKGTSTIPYRFTRVLDAVAIGAAVILLGLSSLSGVGVVASAGYGIVLVVSLLAGLCAVTRVCLGCWLYRNVGRFRNLRILLPRRDTV